MAMHHAHLMRYYHVSTKANGDATEKSARLVFIRSFPPNNLLHPGTARSLTITDRACDSRQQLDRVDWFDKPIGSVDQVKLECD